MYTRHRQTGRESERVSGMKIIGVEGHSRIRLDEKKRQIVL